MGGCGWVCAFTNCNAVDLKHVLGDIQTDRGNLHLDGSPHVIRLRRPPYDTSMPGAGAVHHIKSGSVEQSPAVLMHGRCTPGSGRESAPFGWGLDQVQTHAPQTPL